MEVVGHFLHYVIALSFDENIGEVTLTALGQCSVGLDWIGLTGGYWCRHYSKDCSQAQALPF